MQVFILFLSFALVCLHQLPPSVETAIKLNCMHTSVQQHSWLDMSLSLGLPVFGEGLDMYHTQPPPLGLQTILFKIPQMVLVYYLP